MDAAEQPAQISQWPAPPLEFARLYTDDAVAKGQAPAPPAPIEGFYSMFGQPMNTNDEIIQSLESQGIRQLYSSTGDPRAELKRLTRSLVAAFLDLLEILIRAPESPERQKKLEDIRLIFFNTHHLINEYRPQQARETVQLMLQVQKRDREATIERFEKHFVGVKSSIKNCVADLPTSDQLNLSDELLAEIHRSLKNDDSDSQRKSADEDLNRTFLEIRDQLMCRIVDREDAEMDSS